MGHIRAVKWRVFSLMAMAVKFFASHKYCERGRNSNLRSCVEHGTNSGASNWWKDFLNGFVADRKRMAQRRDLTRYECGRVTFGLEIAHQLKISRLQSCSYPVHNKNSISRFTQTSNDALFQEVGLLAQSLAVIREYMLRLFSCTHAATHPNRKRYSTHQFINTQSFIPLYA